MSISRFPRLLRLATPPLVVAASALTGAALLSGCGSGSGTSPVPGVFNGPAGAAVGLGRATTLLGTYKATQTLAGGQIGETVIQFAPAAAFETLTGTYTVRVLSPRPSGGNDIVDVESGTVAGNVLANGDLNIVATPDGAARSQSTVTAAAHATSRQTLGGGTVLGQAAYLSTVIATVVNAQYTPRNNGATLTSAATGASLSRIQSAPLPATTPAVTLDGAWAGGAATQSGLQLTNPVPNPTTNPGGDNPVPGIPPVAITLSYTPSGTVTISSPQFGTAASAAGTIHIYSQYDANLPANFDGVSSVNAGQYFVIGKGSLPTNAPTLSIPGSPIPVTLAGREFLIEAGGGDAGGQKFQLGSLFVKLKSEEQIFAPLIGANILPGTTSAYVRVGNFYVLKGGGTTTPTPTAPTPSPSPTSTPGTGQLPDGTIQFSNVTAATNANTTKITDTDAQASFSGNTLNATLTEKNGHFTVERDLNILVGAAASNASLAVGTTFPITSGTVSTGKATVTYIESGGSQKFWVASGGSVVVVGVDLNNHTTTLRVVGATMIPLINAGSVAEPTGTFTIDATGKF